MEIAIGEAGKAFCSACEEVGCELDRECEAPHCYCSGGEETEGPDGRAYCSECGEAF
jgi:hypothetical protein